MDEFASSPSINRSEKSEEIPVENPSVDSLVNSSADLSLDSPVDSSVESAADVLPKSGLESASAAQKEDDPFAGVSSYFEEDRTEEISKYTKFKKVDGAAYRKVNIFLRKRTYITAREWAIARLCSDFKTPYGAEMTFIGQHLPELCPFMEETYTPQAVNQARTAFKRKVRKSGATFFYGAMCGFFTMEELDDILYESEQVAKFLLEIENTSLDIDDEIDIEDKISEIMRRVGESANLLLKNRREGVDGDDEAEGEKEDKKAAHKD